MNSEIWTRARNILDRISYKDWQFHVYERIEHTYIQVHFNDNGEPWQGRKWILSQYMTDSEIIQTVFLAIKTAEEHEMREKFKFDGTCVFGPHFDLKVLSDAISNNRIGLDIRREVPV